jgi:hypothetical protein
MNRMIILLVALTVSCTSSTKKTEEHDQDEHAMHEHSMPQSKNVKSPHTAAMVNIGENHVHIDYSSPRVRRRQIFGGLVAYDEVWSTGAHQATFINFAKDVKIEGKIVKAGKYAFFTIPTKENWTIIFNTNWDQHLADEYSKSNDVIRFDVTPSMSDDIIEELTFEVIPKDDKSGTIRFQWEKVTFEFNIINN